MCSQMNCTKSASWRWSTSGDSEGAEESEESGGAVVLVGDVEQFALLARKVDVVAGRALQRQDGASLDISDSRHCGELRHAGLDCRFSYASGVYVVDVVIVVTGVAVGHLVVL